MIVKMVVEKGGRRSTLQLKPPVAVVGRSRGNAVRIPSAQVSRQHCRFRMDQGLVYLDDLGSVNGTFLNGVRIRGRELVRPGDQIEIGPVRFTVEYELTPKALKRLQTDDEPIDAELLDGLADGEVLSLDSDEEVELALDLPEKGTAEDDNLPLLEVADDAFPLKPESPAARPEFTFNKPWELPEADDLRDILSQMEDEDPPPPSKKRKPK
jgi:pSer/pThr/pTyr-binding forkhead associated (FHA) protein